MRWWHERRSWPPDGKSREEMEMHGCMRTAACRPTDRTVVLFITHFYECLSFKFVPVIGDIFGHNLIG
jgi:hypothetical protein